jgi:hypothetical protein
VKHFDPLWWDSRNGFTAREFHRRCDGRTNTLTLISNTEVEHESQEEEIDEITQFQSDDPSIAHHCTDLFEEAFALQLVI